MATLIKQAREAGKLRMFFDFRGGNLADQSGNGLTLTVPGTANLNRTGLRVSSSPATVPLDLSDTQQICVFYMLENKQLPTVTQVFMELTANYSATAGGFLFYTGSDNKTYVAFNSAGVQSAARPTTINDHGTRKFFSIVMDRTKTDAEIAIFERGLYTTTFIVQDNYNDGSAFADSTMYLMARSGGVLPSDDGSMVMCGVVDFTDNAWTNTQQLQLYQEIRDRLTV